MTKFPFTALELDSHPDGDRIKETIKLAVQLAIEDRIADSGISMEWERGKASEAYGLYTGHLTDLRDFIDDIEDDDLAEDIRTKIDDLDYEVEEIAKWGDEAMNCAEAHATRDDALDLTEATLRTHRLI